MSVRRELLERELRKLGFRRSESQRGGADGGSSQLQAQSSQHPQADAPGEHAD